MAQKKITDLQLISAVVDALNIPGDDTIQTYRFTAAQLKAYIFSFLTTGGDILYASAANTPARVANGTLNQILKSAGGTSAPAWTHAVHGDVQTKTTTYTGLVSDSIILCSASGGAWTLTWPTAVGCAGKILGARKTDSSFNAVTISGTGMTTNKLMTQGETAFYISDGTNWHQISRIVNTPWTAWTPTGSWSANTTYTGFWRRVGDSIEMDVKIATSGAPTSATLTVNIVNSSGWTINSGKIAYPSGNNGSFGQCSILDSGSSNFGGTVLYSSTTVIQPVVSNVAGTYIQPLVGIDQTTPMTWANNDVCNFRTVAIPMTDFESGA